MRKLFAAALVLSLAASALAQTATPAPAEPAAPPAAAPAAPPAAAPAPAAKPPDAGVKVTPYGFVLLNAFLDQGTFTTKDYPGAVSRVDAGDAFLMSARQSRLGVRLGYKDDNWTGAEFSGVIEFDFKAGQLAGAQAASTNWYNGVMRLRLAAATASWKFGDNTLAVLAGQEYGLVNPLFAESLAWVADPLFWQAGNLWRRSPQIRATYDAKMGDFGFNLAAAILSPADGYPGSTATPPTNPHGIDFGPGNASGQPDLEARLALRAKMGDIGGTVGVGYHTEKRKYLAQSATGVVTTEDKLTTHVVGVDLDLNVTKFLQVKGEYYNGTGTDDTYNGIATPNSFFGAAGARDTIDVDGYWAQAILKPLPIVYLTAGYGIANADKNQVTAATAREKNEQLAFGLIFNAGRAWRFGAEWEQTKSTYGDAAKFDANQFSVSSMFRF